VPTWRGGLRMQISHLDSVFLAEFDVTCVLLPPRTQREECRSSDTSEDWFRDLGLDEPLVEMVPRHCAGGACVGWLSADGRKENRGRIGDMSRAV